MANTTRGGLTPAVIVNRDNEQERVTFMFNPHEYTLTKQNQWTAEKSKGKNIPKLQFSQGGSQTLKLQLFFDTYAEGADVRDHTKPLWNMVMVNPDKKNAKSKKSRPPIIEFQWGKLAFVAVITNISQKFTLFNQNGIPLRTTVDVTLQQYVDDKDYPPTNPTSGGGEAHKVRTVHAGDRIDLIAFEEYGDATEWRRIAAANDLTHPLRLRPGQQLTIPPLI